MDTEHNYSHDFKVEDGVISFYNVTTGDVVNTWDRYTRYKDWKAVALDPIFSVEVFTIAAGVKKPLAQNFTDKYGIAPSNFLKIFNALMRRVHIQPVEKFVLRYGFGSNGKPRPDKVWLINKHRDLIEQCEADGIRNIIPFVMYMGMSPKQLKEFFGKSTWKYLAGNSEARNKVIAYKLTQTRELRNIVITKDLPLWFLLKYKRFSRYVVNATFHDIASTFIKMNYKQSMFIERDFMRMVHIYTDTKRMANDLGERFNQNWSLRKLQEKHKEFTYKINKQKYSEDPFDWLSDEYHLGEFTSLGCTAKMLKSPLDVLMEGKTMHHCVGGYAQLCNAGEYVVYHITDEDGEESTLGLHRDNGAVSISQHYGSSNKRIENANCKEFVKQLVVKWNKGYREHEKLNASNCTTDSANDSNTHSRLLVG